MGDYKFCPQCGSKLILGERFCGDCGFDTKGASKDSGELEKESVKIDDTAVPPSDNSVNKKVNEQLISEESSSNNNKRALVILVAILALVFAVGGGLYWWFSRDKNQTKDIATQQNSEQTTQNSKSQNTKENENTAQSTSDSQNNDIKQKLDLSRAATYMPKSGVKCTFNVNYPDGDSGTMERISAKVVPNEAVLMSEAEIIKEQGETIGFVTHYVERADGTYSIYDDTPMEIFPVLKNNLIVGQTWEYKNENGSIIWKVLDVGVTLDLGFTTIKNCLMVEEDNQAVGVRTINYFAPEMGKIMQKSSQEGQDYLKLTNFITTDIAEAEAAVKKWAPNYFEIKDDRTQQ